jgi:hypothetical protein
MLSVIFTVSYQSLHAFSHHHSEVSVCHSNPDTHKKSFKHKVSEKEDCPICDFKFTSFISPEIFTYSFFCPALAIPYSFNSKEASSFFVGSLFAHRGPPVSVQLY